MNLWGRLLRMFGWKVNITVPYRDKCLICVAPHTTNWDFPIGLAAYNSIGRKANFLMKEFWFFFPLKYLLKALGGIPVSTKGSSLTDEIIRRMNAAQRMNLAVTPEGTRSATTTWRKGLLYIAYGTEVPIQMGVIDYKDKTVEITDEYRPCGDIETDMRWIKDYYRDKRDAAKYPDKFTTG